ncbi:MAG: hypothetical protein LBN23_03080 [Paludibacter sp.]|jgi:NADPH-dependent 7-cyano-7-deazaguanine reductase QueF|nr:hypothetical protein [Paludibacter sp.]
MEKYVTDRNVDVVCEPITAYCPITQNIDFKSVMAQAITGEELRERMNRRIDLWQWKK